MAFQFVEQLLSQAPQVVVSVVDQPSMMQRKKVLMANGEARNLPIEQIPTSNTYACNTTYRWAYTGNVTQALQGSTPVNIPILRGTGAGDLKSLSLRIVATNNSAYPNQMIPLPLCIQTLQFFTPSGQPISSYTGTELYLTNCGMVPKDQFNYTAELINTNSSYQLAPPIPVGGSVEWQMPIPGNFLSAGRFGTYLSTGDIQCKITFLPNSQTLLSQTGSDLTVTDMSLDAEMTNLPTNVLAKQKSALPASPQDSMFSYTKTMNWSGVMTSGTTTTIPLTGIIGCVTFLMWVIRLNYNGENLYNFFPLSSFQIKDTSGNPITSNQVITDTYNRNKQYPRWWPGQLSYYQNVYCWNHTNHDGAIVALLENGEGMGGYGYTGKENLFITPAVAGASEVLTVTTTATPASGNFVIQFFDGAGGAAQTAPIAYNATASQIAAAIEAINIFQGTVTVSGPITSGSITVTYGGVYSYQPMASRDMTLNFEGTNLVTSGGAPVGFTTTVSTPGAYGIPSGSTFNVDIYAFTPGIINISMSGGSTDLKVTTS